MVIKGQSVAGAKRLAVHLMRTDTNERAEVLELRGVAAEDLRGGLREIEAVASGTRCQKPFYHASINTRADERLTPQQRIQAIDRLEQELGLTRQQRAVVLHEKEGREHCHIVWSRIDLERMRALSDSHNYRKHEIVARELEREFGHARVQGVHVERDGQPRPERTPSHAEMQQAERGGVKAANAKVLITGIWERTSTGQEFRTELEKTEWLLTRGDRRDFVAIDPAGVTHSLARRIDGAKAADIRARMADLDPAGLPSVIQAKATQRERKAARDEQSAAPKAKASANRFEQATGRASKPSARPAPEMDAPRPARAASRGLFMATDATAKGAESLIDFVASITDLMGGASIPRPNAADLARDPAARRAYYTDQAAERESDQALDRMQKAMEAGKGLSRSDVQSLTPAHLLQIRAHGDDYLRQVIDERERDRGGGRERDR